ncbi:hypothetical protein ANO11243_086050 [Dothideomycetidae sp. 11243]|nr:hypothetical protein ANO11243_086050 [fungal sp. No.11243]
MEDEPKGDLELPILHAERDAVQDRGPIIGRADQPSGKQTVVFLDGLRGLAALLVYISHNVSWYYGPSDTIADGFGYKDGARFLATLPFVRVFFTGGSSAVTIFFVLSGFVLSKSPSRMLRDGQKPYNSLLSSTIRRPLRLYTPPAAISLIVAFCLHLPLAPLLGWPPVQENIVVELWVWLKEFLFAVNPFVEHLPFASWFPYNPFIWTMPYEFRGSILVFFLLALFARLTRRARMLLFTFCGLAFLFWGDWAMSCFMGGVVLAMTDLESLDEPYLSRLSGQARNIVLHIIFFSGWYLLSQVSGSHEPERSSSTYGWYWLTMATPKVYYDKEYWRFWHSIGAFMLIYATLRIRWIQLRLASLKYLGRVSFSFYLIQAPFIWIFADRVFRFISHRREETDMDSWFDNRISFPEFGPHGLTSGFIVSQVFLFPLTMFFSHYATVYIDEPSMVLGKWFSTRVMAAIPAD